jgi:Ca2+-binding RTX toxin-like protein
MSFALTPEDHLCIGHAYTQTGVYTVTVKITDSEGRLGSTSHTISVDAIQLQTNPLDDTQQDLAIGGTIGNDTLVVQSGGYAGAIAVSLNGSSLGSFVPTGRILGFGQAGDDDLQIAGSINLAAWLYGGMGNDRLKGGSGDDLLVGEAGDDLLVGNNGRDLLIGGLGSDRIVGNADDDILIAGHLVYADQAHAEHNLALSSIMREWNSGHLLGDKTANLQGLRTDRESAFDLRENGQYFLKTSGADATVFDDDARDLLTGCEGIDWFFANYVYGQDDARLDKITDLHDTEFAADLEYIYSDVSE